MSNNPAKNWCFTINNYTDETINHLNALSRDVYKYLIYGKEVGDNGTPHLQGFIQFKDKIRFAQVKQILGDETIHIEIARNVKASVTYCKKDGEYHEVGSMTLKGKRNDLDDFMKQVENGERNHRVLRKTHPQVAAKFPKFFNDYIADNVPPPKLATHDLRSWQTNLKTQLDTPPDARTITFVVDVTGNHGKTWFAHWYIDQKDNCQVITPGKKADMAYALIEEPYAIFVDCPRSKQGEFIQYDFLEDVKNGFVFSTKYESRMKRFKSPHVVVLMNEEPDMYKLSEDRYNVIHLRSL